MNFNGTAPLAGACQQVALDIQGADMAVIATDADSSHHAVSRLDDLPPRAPRQPQTGRDASDGPT